MFYRAVAATCPGNDKEYNSNNIYLNTKYITDEIKASEVLLKQKKEQEGLQFYGIAEGFGADRYTDEASLIAVRKLLSIQKRASGNEISDNYDEAADSLYAYLEDFIKEANEAVAAKAAELSDQNIYASVAAIGLYETAAITCNVGNTRIYLFRKGHLSRLSEDHNQAQVMYKNGVITEEKAARHPKRNKLTQYLGVLPEGKQLEPYYSEVEVKHGDIFVICSSAFCSAVDDESICGMIRDSRSLSQIAEKLMQAAAEKGFSDDTSILVVRADAQAKAGAAGTAAAAGTASTAAKTARASGETPSAAAKSRETLPEGEGESFMNKLKRFLGLSADSENEKVWPALLTFGCCILVVIILTVLGIKIYNASKSPSSNAPTNPPSANVGTPSSQAGAPTPSGASPSASPSAGQTQAPSSTPTQEPTQAPTEAPVTEAPTEAPTQAPTEAPATEAPTEAPTQAPTEAPVTEAPTEAPTQAPTEAPATETPTEAPTQAPTEAPATEAPTEAPTQAPTEAPAVIPSDQETIPPSEG